MVERLRRARLRQKLVTTARAIARLEELRRNQHERDRAANLEVARAVDFAERTSAKALENVEVRDRLHVGACYFFGRDGRSSMRLGRLREGNVTSSRTSSATSSGAIFQSDPVSPLRPPKPVATEPGMM